MAAGLELESVQKGKGRVHLTPAFRADAPTRTLCGKELAPGAAGRVEAEADCTLCVKRSRDPVAVSSAFFAGDQGERVLELALEQAQARREARVVDLPTPPPRRESKPRPRPAARPEPPALSAVRGGELDVNGLREFSEEVFVGPDGVIVRVAGGRVAEVVGEGRFQLLRRGDRWRLKAGGLVVEGESDRLEAHLDQSP